MRTIDGVIIVGTLVFVLAQFAGYFGSYVYLAAVAPVLCWRVDDWLRMGLPELVRAYGEQHALGRRFVARPSRRRPLQCRRPARRPPASRSAIRAPPRSRSGRPKRSGTG